MFKPTSVITLFEISISLVAFSGCYSNPPIGDPTFLTTDSSDSTAGLGPLLYRVFPITGSTGGGTSITLFGMNFDSTTTVQVGGVTCTSVSVVNANTITCVTGPNTAGAATITVTRSDSKQATLPNVYYTSFFTYVAPQLNSVFPNVGSTAGGSVVSVYGAYFTSGATVKLAGKACSSVTFVSSDFLECTVAASGGVLSGSVVVTNPDGTVATSSSSVTYTYALPVVSSLSPSFGPVAGGTTLTITGKYFTPLPVATPTIKINSAATCTNIIVHSSTTIQCLTTAGTTGTVQVVNTDGGASVDSVTFSYVASLSSFYYGSATPYLFALKKGGTISLTPTVVPAVSAGRYAFSVSPDLPAGLALSISTGIISGTPQSNVASASYTVTATQQSCSASCTSSAVLTFGVIDFGLSGNSLTVDSDGTAHVATTSGTTDIAAVSSVAQITASNYAYVNQSTVNAGVDNFVVDSGLSSISSSTLSTIANGFQVGDTILIIQMQYATLSAGAGATSVPNGSVWELATIKGISASDYKITVTAPLVNTYSSGTIGVVATSKVTQIVKVPSYNNVTINGTLAANRWTKTGSTSMKGGTVAFRANGTVTIGAAGTISADSAGFKGGEGNVSAAFGGENYKGVGSNDASVYTGTLVNLGGGGASASMAAAIGFGGGAGFGIAATAASAGTGGGTSGGTGTTYGGNAATASFNVLTLLLGSGGGGAAHNAVCTYGDPYTVSASDGALGSGGNGGGLVFIMAHEIVIANGGSISAKGGATSQLNSGTCTAVSGAGSGGVVYLKANTITSAGTLPVNVNGGIQGVGLTGGGTGGYGLAQADCFSVAGTNSSNVVSGGTLCSTNPTTIPKSTAPSSTNVYVKGL